ncbi:MULTISPECIES: hydrogenase maturation protease [unclassified Kitasatospora]|uniref:hydrogenase maturation protease n=1 Tax=unclassified Kitasatospora TaxID=2633591 RepID=UPI0033CEF38A
MLRARIVLIGIGNEYRHDDGAAVAVMAELAAEDIPVDRITLCDGEPTRLMELWENADLAIVVGAVPGHPGQPGRIHEVAVFPDREGDPLAESSAAAGIHGLGLGHAVALASALGQLPRELLIVAVEGADFSLGEGLSQAVAEAVPRVVSLIRGVVAGHRAGLDGEALP